jgi:preprotein translocase subunit SecE
MAAVEKFKSARGFLEECWVELTKVTWPDMEQLRSATIVVILFTIAISAIIWLMDNVASAVIRFIMGMFGAA